MYETKTVGEIGVDSGQVLLIDPCYIKKDTLGNEEMNYKPSTKEVGLGEFLNDPTLDNKKNFYTNVCERTLLGKNHGNTMEVLQLQQLMEMVHIKLKVFSKMEYYKAFMLISLTIHLQ